MSNSEKTYLASGKLGAPMKYARELSVNDNFPSQAIKENKLYLKCVQTGEVIKDYNLLPYGQLRNTYCNIVEYRKTGKINLRERLQAIVDADYAKNYVRPFTERDIEALVGRYKDIVNSGVRTPGIEDMQLSISVDHSYREYGWKYVGSHVTITFYLNGTVLNIENGR